MSHPVCSICWDVITKNDQLQAVTVCGHIFHTVCLQSWMRHSETCPQCRADCNSKQQIYLTFEESIDANNLITATGEGGAEINQNVSIEDAQKTIAKLQIELLSLQESCKLDAENHQEESEWWEQKVADLEIRLQEATAKEKTLSEEFHYKLQDLNTEFHYKFQDLKKAKEELLDNLDKASNNDIQLRNKIEEARRTEDQLRKTLKEQASKLMDLECEKAELQSKLDASERNARWLKQSVDDLQFGGGARSKTFASDIKNRRKTLEEKGSDFTQLQSDVKEYEAKKQKMEDKLRKLRSEVEELEEKETKLKAIKKDLRGSKDNCTVV